jgi:hypothetical protein
MKPMTSSQKVRVGMPMMLSRVITWNMAAPAKDQPVPSRKPGMCSATNGYREITPAKINRVKPPPRRSASRASPHTRTLTTVDEGGPTETQPSREILKALAIR